MSSSHQAGIPNLCPGEYLLRIEPDDHGYATWLPQWFDRAETAGGARPILITEPGEIITLDLVFDEGGVIAGRLELPTPSTEYYYVLLYPEDLSGEWARRSLGALDRTFTFVGVPDGRYKVGAVSAVLYQDATSQPPPGTVWHPSTQDWGSADIIEIIDASTVSGVDIVIPGA
ncbi:MAG: hypothetical protein IPI34_13755 [bacterium]|nr:hypothetical protein [bacterium]